MQRKRSAKNNNAHNENLSKELRMMGHKEQKTRGFKNKWVQSLETLTSF